MRIYLCGSIDEDSFREFSEQLDEAENNGDTVEIVLNSAGGTAIDALAFYSRIKISPCKTSITVYGCCHSAAVLVLAACNKRYMTKEAWAMVHEDSTTLKNKQTVDIEGEARQMRRMESQWNHLLAENSLLSAKVWESMHKATTYMNAKECLEAGIIDEVV